MLLTIESDKISTPLSGHSLRKYLFTENRDKLSICFPSSYRVVLNDNGDTSNTIITIDLPKGQYNSSFAEVEEWTPSANYRDPNQSTFRVLEKFVFEGDDISSDFVSADIIVDKSDALWEIVQPLPKGFHYQRDENGDLIFIYYRDKYGVDMTYGELSSSFPELTAASHKDALIKNYAIADSSKAFQLLTLSGETTGSIQEDFERLCYYSTSGTVQGEDGQHIWTVEEHAPENGVRNFIQYGNYIFKLSQETFKRNQHTVNTNTLAQSGDEYLIPPSSESFQFENDIVTYYPESRYSEYPDLSATMRISPNNRMENTNFDFFRRQVCFGIYDDFLEEVKVFVKSRTDAIDEKHVWPVSSLVYQYVDGIPGNYMIQYQDDDPGATSGRYLTDYNFKLKNFYDTEFDTPTDEQRALAAARNYLNLGNSQGYIWLSYKVARDYDYVGEPRSEFDSPRYFGTYSPEDTYSLDRSDFVIDPTQKFEFVESVNGFYKYSGFNKHKSNIFSIRINNYGMDSISGDFTLIDNDGSEVVRLTEVEVKQKLKSLVEDQFREMIDKIKPGHTELWKIIWNN
ncbi:MAG TPA: hypothetical protein PLA71_01005 [Saccharofermentans sp.]|nr:hypothetical protein [Saccharofermentans sp.]